jgi:hypothetical protein
LPLNPVAPKMTRSNSRDVLRRRSAGAATRRIAVEPPSIDHTIAVAEKLPVYTANGLFNVGIH